MRYQDLAKMSLILALSTNLHAVEKVNLCGQLHVQIGNNTTTDCYLEKSKVVHGKLFSSPPNLLKPGHTGLFDIKQTLRGPEIVLEYHCGGQIIIFSSQQNYCLLKAGQVRGNIVFATPTITASYTSQNGSYRWKTPGLVNWVILNR